MQKEKKKSNRDIIVFSCIFVIIFIVVGSYYYNSIRSKRNIDVKLSENLTNQKTFEGMKIYKIRGYEHGDTGHIEIRIKNETGSKVEAQEVKVAFFDTNNKNIGKAYIYIPEMNNKEYSVVDMRIEKELLKADNFKIYRSESEESKWKRM